jgi:hypothetical protein
MGYTRRKMGSKKTTSIYSRRRNYKKGSLKNRRKMTIKNGGGMARDICNVASNLILPKCFSRFNFLQTDSVEKTKSKLERMNNAETPPRFRRYMERNWENYVGTPGHINYLDQMPDMDVYRFLESDDYATIESKLEIMINPATEHSIRTYMRHKWVTYVGTPGHINYLDQMPDMDVYRFLESDDYATIESKLEIMIDPATEHSIRTYMRHKWVTYVGTPGYIEFLVNTRVYNWFEWDTVKEKQKKNERMKNTEIPIDIRSYMIRQGKLLDEEPNTTPAPAYIGDGDYHSDDE